MKLGFIGTGDITAAMVTGFCTAEPRPEAVIVSPRNAAKAARLAAAFPEVTVAADNQQVLDRSNWLILAVLPPVAREVLGALRFRPNQRVVSVIADFPLAEVAALVAPAQAVAQVLPLPPVARHLGPIALCPPNREVAALFSRIGLPVEVEDEAQLNVFWSATALMAPFYGLLGRTADWLAAQGVPAAAAGSYVGTMFHALAVDAREAADGHGEGQGEGQGGFEALIANSQTPGGLNEQCYGQLSAGGWYDALSDGLDGILVRLGGTPRGGRRPET